MDAALFSTLAVMAGIFFPVQTAVNARLAAGVGGTIIATLISFASGCVALSVITLVTTRTYPDLSSLGRLPPWLFVAGGLLGAAYLSLNVFLVSRIGSGAMMALAIAGQMATSLALDRAGAFGLVVREISPGRMFGAICVVLGAAMVRFL